MALLLTDTDIGVAGSRLHRCCARKFSRDGMLWPRRWAAAPFIPGKAVSSHHVPRAWTETSPCSCVSPTTAETWQRTAVEPVAWNPDESLPVHAVGPVAPSPFVQMSESRDKSSSTAAVQSARGRRLMGGIGEPHQSLFRNQKPQSRTAVTHSCVLAQIQSRFDNQGQILFWAVL